MADQDESDSEIADELDAELAQLAARLRKLRKAAGLGMEAAAEKAGLSRILLAKLETGERPNPTVKTLLLLARAYGVHVRELWPALDS